MEPTATKRCPRCGEVKALDAFDPRRGRRCQPYCRLCRREYQRGRPRLLLAKQLLRRMKHNQPCADCGVRYPHYVLDYDHRPGCPKRANLNILRKQGAKEEVLLAEIAKCDLVCASCHRVHTYQRRMAALGQRKQAAVAQPVEHLIGNEEVSGSIPDSSSP
jgi:hypothetical protein